MSVDKSEEKVEQMGFMLTKEIVRDYNLNPEYLQDIGYYKCGNGYLFHGTHSAIFHHIILLLSKIARLEARLK